MWQNSASNYNAENWRKITDPRLKISECTVAYHFLIGSDTCEQWMLLLPLLHSFHVHFSPFLPMSTWIAGIPSNTPSPSFLNFLGNSNVPISLLVHVIFKQVTIYCSIPILLPSEMARHEFCHFSILPAHHLNLWQILYKHHHVCNNLLQRKRNT